MRRERRRFNKEDNIKRVLYIAGGILSLSIIAFIAIFILYGTGNQESTQLAKFNTSVVDDYNTNIIEETSTQMGKTVNEMQNSTSSNVTSNENNTIVDSSSNNLDNSDSDNEDKKYAVNTSKSESKTVDETKKSEEEEKSVENKKEEKENPDFAKPVEGDILREYAKDSLVYSTTLDEWITHTGIDIAAKKTTVVKASADGTVKSIKNDPRYGLTVTIEHSNGFSSVYSNLLTAEFVEEGEKVKQGQTIGTVGNTATFEIADESHLHFEILKDNNSVDPELYLSE